MQPIPKRTSELDLREGPPLRWFWRASSVADEVRPTPGAIQAVPLVKQALSIPGVALWGILPAAAHALVGDDMRAREGQIVVAEGIARVGPTGATELKTTREERR